MSEQALTVDQARAEVDRLHQSELRYSRLQREKADILAQLEDAAGSAALALNQETALEDSRATSLEMANLRADIETCGRTIEAARVARHDAIIALWRAEAAAVRSEADELRREADGRAIRLEELLAPVREFEGCDWVPAPATEQQMPPLGTVMARRIPKTWALRNEAAGLDKQAVEILNRKITESGLVEGTSAEGLVSAAIGISMRFGPTAEEIRAWCAEAEAKELARRSKIQRHTDMYLAPETPIRYVLVWAHAAIDRAQSHVEIAPPREPAPDQRSLGIMRDVPFRHEPGEIRIG